MQPFICVFCGAREGSRPSYAESARYLGRKMALNGWGLVYGGASIGLMGAVARTVLDMGGQVKGIVPEVLDWPEARWDRVTDMEVVPDLTVRKFKMMEASDAFVALPGGLGTMDEMFELAAAKVLNMEAADGKPLFVLNESGYYTPMREMIQNAIRCGFLAQKDAELIRFVDSVDELVDGVKDALASVRDGGHRIHERG